VRPERRGHNDVGAFTEDGQKLLHEKKRASDIGRKKVVKVGYRVVFDDCDLGDSGVRNQHVQPLSNDLADFLPEQCRSIWTSQVRL